MSEIETIDTGFDAVLAGEKWEPIPEAVTATVTNTFGDLLLSGDPANAVPLEEEPLEEEPAVTPDQLVQATKALVRLPVLEPPALARLAREIAMDIKERHIVLKEFGLDNAQYEFLEANNEFFRSALHAACVEWHAPMSTQDRIRVEAAAILEESLVGIGARMQNKAEGLPGVIEAAKLFAKVAGVGEREAADRAPGERFTINIDLGGRQKLATEVKTIAQNATDAARAITLPQD